LKAATYEANPDAKRLYDDLLSNYNRLIRPVRNNSEILTVFLGLKLSQLIEVVSDVIVLNRLTFSRTGFVGQKGMMLFFVSNMIILLHIIIFSQRREQILNKTVNK
jgi:hypothetical protein